MKVVAGDDFVLYLGHHSRTGLYSVDHVRPRMVELRQAADIHVVGYGDALSSLSLEPRLEVLDVILDFAQVLFLVRYPHILESVEFAFGDAREDLLYDRFI